MSEDLRTGQADEPRDLQLSRCYREVAREEPPLRLDAAILAAARREVGAGPRPAALRWLRSWRLPMSIAAVVVLSVSVVTLMREEGRDRLAAPTPDEAVETAPPSATPPVAESPARPAEPPVSGPALEASPKADRSRAEGSAATAGAPAPVPEPAQQDSAATRDRREAPAPLLRRDRPTAEMRAAPLASPMPKSTLLQDYENQPPTNWLDKILELRREGRDPEADELLAEFKKRFPDHPLPPELR